jgi:hypothetical protein
LVAATTRTSASRSRLFPITVLAILQHSQQIFLCLPRHPIDLVQEQGAPFRLRNCASSPRLGMREGAALVPG